MALYNSVYYYYYYYLGVMVLGPLNAIKKITQIGFDWNVMLVWSQLLVKELVIVRVLFQNHRVARQQVWKSICSHCAVDIQLVLVLADTSSPIININININIINIIIIIIIIFDHWKTPGGSKVTKICLVMHPTLASRHQ